MNTLSDIVALLYDDATPAAPSLPPAVVNEVLETVALVAEALSSPASNPSSPPTNGGDNATATVENGMVVAALTAGAELVGVLLMAAETVEESTAVAATSALSSLVGGLQGRLGDVGGTSGTVDSSTNATAATSSVRSAMRLLAARAVDQLITEAVDLLAAAGGGAGASSAPPPPLMLHSANLNLTLAVSEPAALGDEPFACNTASTPVEVVLPTGIMKLLSAAGQGTEDETVGVVCSVTSFNLHGGTRANLAAAGPLVSFSLRQAGAALKVDNLTRPINLTLPHTVPNVGPRPSLASSATGGAPYVCAGRPMQQEAAALLEQLLKTNDGSTASEVAELRASLRGAGCDKAVECNYWAESTGAWSDANCRTTGVSEASVGCSCDHLTDFINVVVPTSWDELAEYAVDGKPPPPLP